METAGSVAGTRSTWTPPSARGRARAPSLVRCRALAMEQPPSVRTVAIPFSDLKERGKDLSGKIEEGLGPNGLGIISISDVPDFPALRRTLLRLAPRVANLPEDVKRQLEDPDSRYNFGWSHGKEKLEPGKLDTFKGSYYANPILDVPTTDDVLHGVEPYDGESLEQTVSRSRCHKGRLLYYFPRQFSTQKEGGSVSSWCGWHTDYGSLTGLTCGLFMRNSLETPCPDSTAGLYIRTRDNQVVKVTFGEDELAYQIGETTELLSRGSLCATPHCVQAPSSENASNVECSTFAMFMQPDWNETLKFPSEIPYHKELISPNGALTFGEYSERLVNKYYQGKTLTVATRPRGKAPDELPWCEETRSCN